MYSVILLPFGKIFHSNLVFDSKEKEGYAICNETCTPKQIYDRIFKRIFSLSDIAIINLINGLFEKNFPLNSSVTYPNREFIRPDLKSRIADIFLTIGDSHTFHLEAQMKKDHQILLRIFEYNFYYAMSVQEKPDYLNFPESIIIYLNQQDFLPEKSTLHISFGDQGTFDYRIKNFACLTHNVAELNQKKMIVLIPFQILRLRNLLAAQTAQKEESANIHPSEGFFQLQEEIQNDIIKSIEVNFQLGNITLDDASQLLELANQLYEHICADFLSSKEGGIKNMKPLLPGALELPNDKYRFRIDELEQEITRYADENARYADEILKLKKRIAELEEQQPSM